MADQWAEIDVNSRQSLIATSSSDNKTIVRLWADPITHRLLVDSSGGNTTGYQQPTGTVNGSNQIFVFTTAPDAVSVDGVTKQKTSSDGTSNWTGTTTITLTVAPNFDIFGIA